MIYLDHNATTPIHPAVYAAMEPYLSDEWGNPSSSYGFGSRIKSKIEESRNSIKELINARLHNEILFTSGGTESNNSAIHSAILSNSNKKHIITSNVEHSSVISYCRYLEKYHGYKVTYLPVDQNGLLSIDALKQALTPDTALVSTMWANNETGVLFPISEISKICQEFDMIFHCDAVQAVGKIPINVREIHFDFLSLSGHKIGAPKGVGALYINRKTPFISFLHGGHQERGRRGGTENIASIIGFGVACTLIKKEKFKSNERIRVLRDFLESNILSSIPNCEINGDPVHRLPNTSNITFHDFESESILLLLDNKGICASSGSACLAESNELSHVITAMKPNLKERKTIRFSLNSSNIHREIEKVCEALREIALALS